MESVSFRYTEDDVVSGNLAFYRSKLQIPATRALWLFLLIWVGGIVGLVLWIDDTSPIIAGLGGLAAGVIALVLIHRINLWYLRRYGRRNFAQQRSLADTHIFSWNAAGFETRSDRGSQKLDWSDLHRWWEDDRLLMLYLAERLYIAVPKRALSAEQINALREHLSSALPGWGHKA